MGWLRRLRGAVGMGVTWALCWAVAGVGIGALSLVFPQVLSGPFFQTFDAPLPMLAVPGFFGGLFFSAVLGIAGRKRRFSELSYSKFVGWGAIGGALLSVFPVALFFLRLVHPAAGVTLGDIVFPIAIPFVNLGALSAAVTLGIARAAERRADVLPDHEPVGIR